MTPATAILVPVLNRPHRVAPLLESIEENTPEPHRVLFLCSSGDDVEYDALTAAGVTPLAIDYDTRTAHWTILAGGWQGTWPVKINQGYLMTTEPFVFTAADDLKFYPGWLAEALRVMRIRESKHDTFPGVVGTVDKCNGRTEAGTHSTHSLVRRAYIEEDGGTIDGGPGVVLHEGYAHDYADDELVAVAQSRGRYAHAHGSVVEHLHPLCGKAPNDSTYELGMRIGPRPGRRLFNRRRQLWEGDFAGHSARRFRQ